MDSAPDLAPTFMQHLAALSEWLDPVTVAASFEEVWTLYCDGAGPRETGETILATVTDSVTP